LLSKSPLGYVDVRVFVHATEDEEKVLTAVRNILPREVAEDAVFTRKNLSGHHGNPILLVEAKLTDRAKLPMVLKKIAESLSPLDRENLTENIETHMERGNLYLRLDKQAAYFGKVKLGSADAVHLKFHFRNRTVVEILDFCTDAGLIHAENLH